MTTEIHNGMDIIDSRDIIARHSELQELRDDLEQEAKDLIQRIAELRGQAGTTGWDIDSARKAAESHIESLEDTTKYSEQEEVEAIKEKLIEAWVTESGTILCYSVDYGEDEESEFQALNSFVEELPTGGEACVRDSYFETYAQDLAEEIGAIDRNARWPLNHIDWEAAADELKTDYSSFEWDGITYWYRS